MFRSHSIRSARAACISAARFRRPILSAAFLFLLAAPLFAQLSLPGLYLRDERGDSLPTPAWPPPDSDYDKYGVTVWFNRHVINDARICEYWHPATEAKGEVGQLAVVKSGCFAIDTTLITHSGLVATLQALGATQMCQYTTFSPCRDTLSFTRWGDTIRTPEFWHSFVVHLDGPNAVNAVQVLTVLYGGTAVDFAELCFRSTLDGVPNDPTWANQHHLMNLLHGVNAVEAWDIEHGDRHIKVAVVDDGFHYNHPDFGGGIGGTNRFVDGREFRNNGTTPPPIHRMSPPSNGGEHGTPAAGFIGAMTDNNLDVASIAGGWNVNEGVSLYAMKVRSLDPQQVITVRDQEKDLVDAWIDAAARTSGPQPGFGVHVISNSNGSYDYSEERRRALDYAYRLGVVCVSSKGNHNDELFRVPADYDYSKIIAVGAMGVAKELTERLVPVRLQPGAGPGGSNWGYGVDVLAPGTDQTISPIIHINQTLKDSGGVRAMTQTSAATPQVAAIVALILSEHLIAPHPNLPAKLYPEDVQGLLSISALDLNFQPQNLPRDTTGYDAQTGYGLVKADQALRAMQAPYFLKHYTEVGGTREFSDPEDFRVYIENLIVQAPTHGEPIIPPTSAGHTYQAFRHRVRKTVPLTGWTTARSWGRGGDSAVGWSGAQPLAPDQNANVRPTGYTRVLGEGATGAGYNFNPNNIRDISYRSDSITLETFIYAIYEGADFLGWYPTTEDNVVYRYSVWGANPTLAVEERPAVDESASIAVRCDTRLVLGERRALIRYRMGRPGPATVTLHDALGRRVAEVRRDFWGYGEEETVSINVADLAAGVYIATVRSDAGGAGSATFTIVK